MPLSPFGRKTFIQDRVVDTSCNRNIILKQADRYAPNRETMREIGGAIERIDYPEIGRFLIGDSPFLGHKTVIREIFRK